MIGIAISKRRDCRKREHRPARLLIALAALLLSLSLLSCSPFESLDATPAIQSPVQRMATVALSEEEQTYIASLPPLRVNITDGAAPLIYVGAGGKAQGIGIRVLDEVALRTGLELAYRIFPNQELAFSSGADIFPLISPNYVRPGMVLSTPYLVTETVLCMNARVSGESLDDKRFAAVRGGALPQGVDESQVLYYDNREYAIDAVEHGLADYSYGNAYSIAYLTLKNGYRNLVTVPLGVEERQYSIGLFKDDPLLLSIINKALSSITASQMQSLILDEASRVEQTITLSMIMEQHGPAMLLVSLFFIVVLIVLSASNIRQTMLLKRENLRYEALFEISHEYLFEFEQKSSKIVFSPQTIALFGSLRRQDQAMQALASVMKRAEDAAFSSVVDLKVHDGSLRHFRISIVKIVDPLKRAESCIGRLTDISEEEWEKADLRSRVVTDGLTGLLNQVAIRQRIERLLLDKPAHRLDFLVLMDCDRFKQVNDTYGHLAGDRFLKLLGESLAGIFKTDAVIGRLGGDEFCVYIPGADSIEAVLDQCNLVNPTFQQRIKAPFTVSIGVTAVEANDEYDSLFRRADIALYQVKREGGGASAHYLPGMGT